jgi:hypothetical protein
MKPLALLALALLVAAPAFAADKAVMSTPEQIVYYCAGQAGVSTDPHAALTPDQFRRLMWCVENNKHRIKAK